MRMAFSGCCTTLLVLSLLFLPSSLGPARAADSEAGQVTVDGPYTIRQETEPFLGAQMGEVKLTVSQRVSIADLDFSRQADVNMLRERVKTAARESCLELERRFPPSIYAADNDRRECIRDATREGIAQAMIMLQEKAIAQARGPAEARARLSVIR